MPRRPRGTVDPLCATPVKPFGQLARNGSRRGLAACGHG